MTDAQDIQGWVDKSALTELIANLSAAVDRADKDAIVACYTPQSYDDHGAFKGSGSEFAEMICAPDGRAERLRCITYWVSQSSTFTVTKPGVKRFSSCTH